jgi:hypothetical protein
MYISKNVTLFPFLLAPNDTENIVYIERYTRSIFDYVIIFYQPDENLIQQA